MSKKIIFIQGSPRKNGNTRAMATIAMEAARAQNAEITEIDATALEFKTPGCTGCQKCQQSEKFTCTINDQVSRAVASLPDYDVIVMVTPLYWWSFSAQIKILIDRVYSLIKFSEKGEIRTPLSGKVMALMATGGGPLENNLELLESQWKNPADMLGCQFLSCLFPNVTGEAGGIRNDPSAVKKAQEFGRLLASGG
jgi:multimeric flavodoxin WrbA